VRGMASCWRRIDLKRVIAERFGVDFHPRYVGKLLQKLGFSHISARPRHPAPDERIVEAFKNVWPAPSARGLSSLAADQSASTYPASRNSLRP
jgi:Winged helix-turn helix